MGLNREIFGIIIFMVGMIGFLTLFISTGPTAQLGAQSNLYLNNTNTETLNFNVNESQNSLSQGYVQNQGTNCIGQSPSDCSGDYSCVSTSNSTGLCTSTASTGLVGQQNCISFNTSPLSGAGAATSSSTLNALSSIPTVIAAGFEQIFKAITGQKTISPSPIQCNGVGTIQGAVTALVNGVNGGTYGVGGEVSLGSLLSDTIGIVAVVGSVALALSILGDGDSALYVGSAGIGIALIYFMESILASTIFTGTPGWLMALIIGFSSAFYIWIIMALLRS
jgi:hypothetical protein